MAGLWRRCCFCCVLALRPRCQLAARTLLEGEYGTYLEATEAVKLEIKKDRGLLDDTAATFKKIQGIA